MSTRQLAYALFGLIMVRGMFILNNIPNIYSAGKLWIKNKEWRGVGVPSEPA
jgi:predicted cation transporter